MTGDRFIFINFLSKPFLFRVLTGLFCSLQVDGFFVALMALVPGIKGKSIKLEAIGRRGLANDQRPSATWSIIYNQDKVSTSTEKIVIKFNSHIQNKNHEEQRPTSRLHSSWNECEILGNYKR